jgi:signal transduction histidine kinase
MAPPIHVFMLFFIYMLLTLTLTFFIRAKRVLSRQVKPVVVVSYVVDLVFVTLLFLFDALAHRGPGIRQSEFYLLYFLVVLRGFAFFRSPREHIGMSVLVSAMFISSLWLQEQSFTFIVERSFLVKFALIWLVILMSWFIVEIINQQQQEVMRVREQLLRSENLARLGEVAAGIAHEINNPIGIISAYSEYLMRQSAKDDPRQGDFETIHAQAIRCKTIVSEMMSLASPGTIEFSTVRLEPLLHEVLGAIPGGDGNESPCRFEQTFEPGVPAVRGQPDQLRQAFLNVLINARQAMPEEGGTVRIEARRLAKRASAPVQILIVDTGSGIDPGDAEKVFEPFFTRKPKGTGLGLAITRRIIEAHGGTISLRPGDGGKGTVVEIILPVDDTSP